MIHKILSAVLVLVLFVSCSKEKGVMQNPDRLTDIQRMLSVQKELTSKSQVPIWDIFNTQLSTEEKQALEFVYAYMPLSDLADYQPEFLSNAYYLQPVTYSRQKKNHADKQVELQNKTIHFNV